MAQDFYQRTQALYEEFQRRELNYLNAEKQWNSMIWKRDPDPSLQDYLQKINQREKETEETYNNVMKQMTELDKHTHMMSCKLEKLGILRSSVPTAIVPNWSSNASGSNFHLYEASNIFSAKANSFRFPLAEHDLKSVSTQTQNKIYCDKCDSQVLIFDHHSTEVENLPEYSPNMHSMGKFTPLTSDLPKPPGSATLLNENKSLYKSVPSPVHSVHACVSSNAAIESEINEHIHSKVSKQDVNISTVFNGIRAVPLKDAPTNKEVDLSKNVVAESDNNSSNNKEVIEMSHIETKSIVCEKNEPSVRKMSHQTNIEDTMDISVLKSDEESMNREFDFLESDAANELKEMKSEVDTKLDESSLGSVDPSFVKSTEKPSTVEANNSNTNTKNRNSKLNVTGDKSDTSGSVTEPPSPSSIHSANLSVASDSDSISGKEIPLTASAAYQALLGNTVIPVKASKKEYSDSDSEDEVEHAFASAVKKNRHIPPKSLLQPKKNEKTTPEQVDSNPITKASKPTPVNKPQSKLSKSTRKVLGLDTSSGSEVELAVKPAGGRIEEDSDEFDFYG